MYTFNVLDRTGHTPLKFSEADKAKAEKTFKKFLSEGRYAYANNGDGTQRQLKAFDPTVKEVTIARQLAGG